MENKHALIEEISTVEDIVIGLASGGLIIIRLMVDRLLLITLLFIHNLLLLLNSLIYLDPIISNQKCLKLIFSFVLDYLRSLFF